MAKVVNFYHQLTRSQKKRDRKKKRKKKREVPLKLIALVCLMSLVPKYLVVQLKEELKAENRLSTFVVVEVVNTETFMSFIKLPF